MSKRGIIIGGGLVVLLGIGCLGLTTIGGVGAWLVMGRQPAAPERVYSEFGDHSGPAADPMQATDAELLEQMAYVVTDPDVDTDSDSDSDSDSEAVVQAAVSTRSSSSRRTRPLLAPAPSPLSAPGEPEAPIPEEENLDDIDLERTAIEILDEELTPRERRRLRRREGRN